MRIVCPSCNAQYEVDVSLLSDEGREVQCSSCGHIWFQHGTMAPAATRQAAPAQTKIDQNARPDTRKDEPSKQGESETSLDQGTQPIDDAETNLEDETGITGPEDLPTTGHPHKPVDPKVLDILRDEAEYEARQRARDSSGLETQPELGLLGAAPWPSKPDPLEDQSLTSQPADTRFRPASPSFPDIDDISESLEPVGHKRDRSSAFEVPATGAEKRRSFLRGLMLPISFALILVALYLAAPAIIEVVPGSAPVLTGYVNAVDGLRSATAGLFGM